MMLLSLFDSCKYRLRLSLDMVTNIIYIIFLMFNIIHWIFPDVGREKLTIYCGWISKLAVRVWRCDLSKVRQSTLHPMPGICQYFDSRAFILPQWLQILSVIQANKLSVWRTPRSGNECLHWSMDGSLLLVSL